MLRNSILYHRLWYLKKRSMKKLHVYFRLLLILIILGLMMSYANKMLLPAFNAAVEFKVKSVVNQAVNSAVREIFSDHAGYGDFIVLNRDPAGELVSIDTDVAKLNRLSSELSSKIYERLLSYEKNKISVPLGSLFGDSIFSSLGPDLHIAVKTEGSVGIDFRSEFSDAGINQTRYRLFLLVVAEVKAIAPGIKKRVATEITVRIAETVVIGIIP